MQFKDEKGEVSKDRISEQNSGKGLGKGRGGSVPEAMDVVNEGLSEALPALSLKVKPRMTLLLHAANQGRWL